MKGKVMTLQERRMLCKTVATSDNCLGDYYRLYRQAKKLYPANSYASEYSLTSFTLKISQLATSGTSNLSICLLAIYNNINSVFINNIQKILV